MKANLEQLNKHILYLPKVGDLIDERFIVLDFTEVRETVQYPLIVAEGFDVERMEYIEARIHCGELTDYDIDKHNIPELENKDWRVEVIDWVKMNEASGTLMLFHKTYVKCMPV